MAASPQRQPHFEAVPPALRHPLTVARMEDHNVPVNESGRLPGSAMNSRAAHLGVGVLLVVAAVFLAVGTIAKAVLSGLGFVILFTGLGLYYKRRDAELRR